MATSLFLPGTEQLLDLFSYVNVSPAKNAQIEARIQMHQGSSRPQSYYKSLLVKHFDSEQETAGKHWDLAQNQGSKDSNGCLERLSLALLDLLSFGRNGKMSSDLILVSSGHSVHEQVHYHDSDEG